MGPKADTTKLEQSLVELEDEVTDLADDIKQCHTLGKSLDEAPEKLKLFRAHISRLDSTFDKFLRRVSEAIRIATSLDNASSVTSLGSLRTKTRDLFYESLSFNPTESEPPKNEQSFNGSRTDTMSRIKLPTINVPTFNGDLSNWAPFRDTFMSLIHDNDDLTSVQKFHYLKSALKGTAAQTISAIPITSADYDQAWAAMKTRYENKRLQATNHLTKIFNFKPLQNRSFEQLEAFSENVLENAAAFNRLDIPDKSGVVLYTFALRLLDKKTRENFENAVVGKSEVPTFADFEQFIHQQCTLLHSESIAAGQPPPAIKSGPPVSRINKRVLMSTNSSSTDSNLCPICHDKHALYRCQKFLTLDPKRRYDRIKPLRLCTNCLSSTHTSSKCTSKAVCRFCNKTHHSLLHFPSSNNTIVNGVKNKNSTNPSNTPKVNSSSQSNQVEQQSDNQPVADPRSTILSASTVSHAYVLLGTAMARIEGKDGRFHSIRILIDSGSQRSFVTTACAKKLGLKTFINPQPLRGFSDEPIPGGKYQADCTLVPRDGLMPELKTCAVVISRITGQLPLWPLPEDVQNIYTGLNLADPLFWKPGSIDFLLGADLFGNILTGDSLVTPEGSPTILKTIFGCVLIGPMRKLDKETANPSVALMTTSHLSQPDTLDKLVQRFWEVENVENVSKSSPEDLRCENHFRSTHSRDDTGRYMVRLPFKNVDAPNLGDSYAMASLRFRKLEYRLDKIPELKHEYSQIIQSYLDANYICPVMRSGKYYLPHHGVVKDRSTTKVRIVFDASFSTSLGSLNDHLMTGPKLQLDIKDVILNFRRFPYVISADISQMYLQILVHPEDRLYQHFLYRFNATEPITDYEINRLPFGLSCSPFLAIRTLRQLLEDEGSQFPLAVIALQENIYVDDILTGANSLNSALELQSQIVGLLSKGGFSLKKWASNAKPILDQVPHSQREDPFCFSTSETGGVKILGLTWDPSEDFLSYSIQVTSPILSKRGVLSTIARMYDPLGYLAPVTFKAKTLMQSLWRLELGWDAPLPASMCEMWKEFVETLPILARVRIPRCLFPTVPTQVSLVGFADASSAGYAAVIYLRVQYQSSQVRTHLLLAKTRLAPLKPLSIPRLELCAALLLAQTLKSLSSVLTRIKVDSKYLLSDSTIVLSWLRTPPHTLKTFVANRVVAILEETDPSDWYHVASADNAADIPSRGLSPDAIINNTLWWQGPIWLLSDSSVWPIQQPTPISPIPETKTESFILSSQAAPDSVLEVAERFSSFSRLTRVFAYVERFINNAKPGTSKRVGMLTLTELQAATNRLIKMNQQFYFASDLPLEDNGKCSFSSLAPFVDVNGIVRVGGRLYHSSLPDCSKYPVLLPAKSHFSQLLVDYYHRSYLHAGPQLLLSLIQRRYWIISARRLIRSRVHSCLTCHKLRVKCYTPYMADLPPSRFETGRAFLNTGIDFAGPFFIKESQRRKAASSKAYICLFVCMSTKAVHIEVVSDLTTTAFLACLDRFVARRGIPCRVLSDHGTNFIGADRHLKELYRWLKDGNTQQQIREHFLERKMQWEFIPPAAPHFGGIWEAGVKSFKAHLSRVINGQVLTYEELNTLAIRIEAVLNSRPLYALSSSPTEFDTLTPGHFLVGGPVAALPEHDLTETSTNRLSRWQMLSQFIQTIWNRWRRDYLHSLQQRAKWRNPAAKIEEGALVLLKDDSLPPLYWPTGRIIKTCPGPDGIVRVVKIKTSKGEYMRPVTRLAPLLPD